MQSCRQKSYFVYAYGLWIPGKILRHTLIIHAHVLLCHSNINIRLTCPLVALHEPFLPASVIPWTCEGKCQLQGVGEEYVSAFLSFLLQDCVWLEASVVEKLMVMYSTLFLAVGVLKVFALALVVVGIQPVLALVLEAFLVAAMLTSFALAEEELVAVEMSVVDVLSVGMLVVRALTLEKLVVVLMLAVFA